MPKTISTRCFFAAIFVSFLLLIPVWLNGAPYYLPHDSAGYLKPASIVADKITRHKTAEEKTAVSGNVDSPDTGHAPPPVDCATHYCGNPFYDRPVVYSVLLLPSAVSGQLFFVPVLQALIASFVILRFLRALGVGVSPFKAVVLGVVLLLTALPIHIGYVMPDVFTGILILAVVTHILLWPKTSGLTKALEMACITFMTVLHLGNILLLLLCAAILTLTILVFWRRLPGKSVFSGFLLPAVLSLTLLVSVNYAISRQAVPSISSPVFLLAKLLEDGPAIKYLAKTCPEKNYIVCSDLDTLSAAQKTDKNLGDHFLWSADGPNIKNYRSMQFVLEAKEIAYGTMTRYPIEVVRDLLIGGAKQLVSFNPESVRETYPKESMDEGYEKLAVFSPDWAERLKGSKEFSFVKAGEMKYPLYDGTLSVIAVTIAFGLCAGFAILFQHKRRDPLLQAAAICAVCVLGNAVVTGLSELHDRYQSRVVWIVPVLAFAFAVRFHETRTAPNERTLG